jgi:hypothetical protein
MTEPQRVPQAASGLTLSLVDWGDRSDRQQSYIGQIQTCADLGIAPFFRDGKPSSREQPAPGFDRPYTNTMLDRAFAKLPAFLADALLNRSFPAILVGYYSYQDRRDGQVSVGINYRTCRCELQPENKNIIITEIALLDFPSTMGFGQDAPQIKLAVYVPQYNFSRADIGWSDAIREIFASPEAEILETQITNHLSALSFDQIGTEGILHEIGHAIWFLLPDQMKEEWIKEIYPMWPAQEMSGIYLRCLVYSGQDPLSFYQEAFADKWARAFAGRDAEVYEKVGRTIRETEEQFILRAVAYLHEKVKSGRMIHEID